jgi:hypothetical protein
MNPERAVRVELEAARDLLLRGQRHGHEGCEESEAGQEGDVCGAGHRQLSV